MGVHTYAFVHSICAPSGIIHVTVRPVIFCCARRDSWSETSSALFIVLLIARNDVHRFA
jgi:hypothetical protein